MTPLRALRLATMGTLLLTAAIVAITFVEFDQLPDLTPEYPVSTAVVVLGLASVVGVLVGSIAIIVRKKWGAWLHLICSAVGTLAAAFMGPQVVTPASATVQTLLMVATGFIYGLSFFTEAFSRDE